jgi:membrane-associated phospholipid phosphatase
MPNERARDAHSTIAASRWRVVCLAALGLFVGLAIASHAGGVLLGDIPVRAGLLSATHTRLDDAAVLANFAGSWKFLLPAYLALFALSRAARREWWLWGSAIVVAALVEQAVKWLVGRARPDGESLGFPSGHVTAITVFAVIVIYLAARGGLSRRARLTILGGVLLLVALVGLARIFLNAHWPSDVLGGLLLGLGCGAAAAWWHSARMAQPEPSGAGSRA